MDLAVYDYIQDSEQHFPVFTPAMQPEERAGNVKKEEKK